MSRTAKQFLYGLFYIAIIALLAWWLFGDAVTPAPTCMDGIQNQGEAGIDCGGPCALSCAQKDREAFQTGYETPVLLLPDGRVSAFVSVTNPYEDAAVSFAYDVVFRGTGATTLERVRGSDEIGPGRTEVIYAGARLSGELPNRALLSITDMTWHDTVALYPELRVDITSSTLQDGSVSLAGVLHNDSAVRTSRVKLIGVLNNAFGFPVFAYQTILTNVSGFSETPFRIDVPVAGKESDVALEETSIFINSE